MSTRKASAPQNDSRKSHLVRAALHPPPGLLNYQQKAALTPTTSDSTNVRQRLRKHAGCPKYRGGDEHKPKDGGLRLTSLLSLLVSDLYRTDRQADHQLWSFSGSCHPLGLVFQFPLALKPSSVPCDESERATIPSSLKDRSKSGWGRWI